jgi:hypothetical protein
MLCGWNELFKCLCGLSELITCLCGWNELFKCLCGSTVNGAVTSDKQTEFLISLSPISAVWFLMTTFFLKSNAL